jgi:hypothetical protein
MRKQTPLIAFAACIATLSSIGIPTAQAKQQCSAAMPSNPHGYWSWRLIDGRKCWYEGKPMLCWSGLRRLQHNRIPMENLQVFCQRSPAIH